MADDREVTIKLKVDESGAVSGFLKAQQRAADFKKGAEDAAGPSKALADAFRSIADQGNALYGAFSPVVATLGAAGLAIGAASLAAKTSLSYFRDLAFQVRDLAFLSGGTAEQVSGLLDVVGDFGVEAATVERAMVFLSRAVQDGSPALDRLGISIRTSSGHLKSAHDLFYETIDRLQQMRSETERNAVAQELFGRGWTQMVPIIEQGAAKLREAAAASQLVMTRDDIRRADEYRQAIENVKDTVDRLKLAIGREIVVPITIALSGPLSIIDKILAAQEEQRRKIVAQAQADKEQLLRGWGIDISEGDRWAAAAEAQGRLRAPTAPEGPTAGELKAQAARDKARDEALKKDIASQVAYVEELKRLDDLELKYTNELLQAEAKAREDSKNQALKNEYESLTAQHAILVEALEFGRQFLVANAKQAAADLATVEEDALAKRDALDEARRRGAAQQLDDLNKILAVERERADLERQSYESVFQGLFAQANAVGGEAGQGLGMMAAGLKGITDIGAGKDEWSQRYAQAEEYFLNVNILREQGLATEEQLQDASLRRQFAQTQMFEQQRAALMAGTAQMGAGAMLAMYNLTGQKHKEFFIAFQAMKIAETVINTYAAAVAAYNAMASIPYVGPALGAAAAAAVIAFGLMQVAAIASMKPGGGAGASAAPPPTGGGGYAYSQPTTSQWEREQESPRPMQVQVHVYGSYIGDKDAFARDLSDSLRKAWQDGA